MALRRKGRKRDRQNVFHNAGGILGVAGNRVKMILGLIICIAATVSVLYIVTSVSLLVPFDFLYVSSPQLALLIEIALVALIFVALFVSCAPVYLGLYSMALDMRHGMPCTLADLFVFFDPPSEYVRGLRISVYLLGRGCPFLMIYLLSLALEMTGESLFSSVFGFLGIPLLLWGFYMTGRSYPFLTFALCNPTVPLERMMVICKAMTRRRMGAIFVFRMRLCLSFLLSLLSLGVATLLHVAPLSVFATHEFSFALAKQHMAELD